MNLSFKPKQPTPMETVLSLARAIVVGGPWALVPEDKWHAMHERHEADAQALRSALARVVEVEAQRDRIERDLNAMTMRANEWKADAIKQSEELAVARYGRQVLTTIIEDARPWICCVPNEWPNDKVIDVKKRMDSVIFNAPTARGQK